MRIAENDQADPREEGLARDVPTGGRSRRDGRGHWAAIGRGRDDVSGVFGVPVCCAFNRDGDLYIGVGRAARGVTQGNLVGLIRLRVQYWGWKNDTPIARRPDLHQLAFACDPELRLDRRLSDEDAGGLPGNDHDCGVFVNNRDGTVLNPKLAELIGEDHHRECGASGAPVPGRRIDIVTRSGVI